jgi:hypothetical protein
MGDPVNDLRIYVARHNWGQEVEFLVQSRRGSVVSIASPLEFTELLDGHLVPAPTGRMEPEAAQALMDQLWDIGFRPTRAEGSAGTLEAVKYHLEDMRKIALPLVTTSVLVKQGQPTPPSWMSPVTGTGGITFTGEAQVNKDNG